MTEPIPDIPIPIIDDVSHRPHLAKWQRLVDAAAAQFRADLCCIKSSESDGLEMLVLGGKKAPHFHRGQMIGRYQRSYCENIVAHQTAFIVPDARADNLWRSAYEFESAGLINYFGMPIFNPDESLFGTFSLCHSLPQDYSENQINLVSVLKESLESDLAMDYWQQKFISLAETDDITGLPNRRGFFAQSQRMYEMAKREKRDLVVFCFRLLNLDGIKKQHGNHEAELTLACFAASLKESTRKTEVLGRVGANLFVVMSLPSSDLFCDRVIPRIQADIKSRSGGLSFSTQPLYTMAYDTFSPPHRDGLEAMVKSLSEQTTRAPE